MKRNGLYIIACSLLVSMVACMEDKSELDSAEEEAGRIYLSAGIGETVMTRAPYLPQDESGQTLHVPTTDNPLDVSVWASTTTNVFPNSGLNGSNGYVAIHTHAHFQSGDPQLLGEAVYPKGQNPVYFVGLHPQSVADSKWTTTDTNHTHAQYTFTGKEDVMFAPQISGYYNLAYASSPTFHFHHLLTLLRIKMVADVEENDIEKKEAVRDAWGKITNLTISSKNKVIVDLSSDSTGVVFENPTDMSLYKTGTDEVFPKAEGDFIPTTEMDVAYVMCAPVMAAYKDDLGEELVPEYTLHIRTVNRELDIPIDLKWNSGTEEASYFTGTTMGRQFSLLLNFKMGNIISVAAEISLQGHSDWFTHGTGTEDLTEGDLSTN